MNLFCLTDDLIKKSCIKKCQQVGLYQEPEGKDKILVENRPNKFTVIKTSLDTLIIDKADINVITKLKSVFFS